MGQWVAAFFAYGFMLAPRFTRAVAWVFVINTISDLLNMLYETAMDLSSKASGVMEQKMESSSTND